MNGLDQTRCFVTKEVLGARAGNCLRAGAAPASRSLDRVDERWVSSPHGQSTFQ